MPKSKPLKFLKRQDNLQGVGATSTQATECPTREVTNPPPSLVLPFPPQVKAEDLLDCGTRQLPSKPPNAFFIYRKVYTKELIAQNLRFKMTDVSPWVSMSWKRESEDVKMKYKEIAKEVRQIYKKAKQDNINDMEGLSAEIASTQFGNSSFPTPSLTDSQSSTPELNQDLYQSPTPELSQDQDLYQFGLSFQSDLQAALNGRDLDFFDCSSMEHFQITNPLGLISFQPQDVPSTFWQGNDNCNGGPSTGMTEISDDLIQHPDYAGLAHQNLDNYFQFADSQQFDIEQIWNFQENLDFLFDDMNQPSQWSTGVDQ
ncbi:4332_t:CDS:1 [Acaulospora colombiana]|uniref:4332_t:CDS:1 n=1 Tax=Acaulospora colombiana TaxID=27376 RepID=A0ACA9K8M5_9GLOM|nr:4332_t:CDS:1 [Acaulospora colombiana]